MRRAVGWRDADGIGAAGANLPAGDRAKVFAEADFNGSQIVIAAAEGETGALEGGISGGEEVKDRGGRHGDLVVQGGELTWDDDRAEGASGEVEELLRSQTGTGAVHLPLVAKETGVWVDVAKGGRIGGTGGVAAVLGVSAVVGLGPEAVEDEAEMLSALGSAGVGGAELRGPGEVKQVEIEGARDGCFWETAAALPVCTDGIGSG